MPKLTPRQLRVGFLLALAPFALVAVLRWEDPPATTDGDYAHYLLHAQAIADGRPYSDIGYIYTDLNLVGPRNQPPGWPLVLAPFVKVFGIHSGVFRVLVTLLVAAFGVTAGMFVARKEDHLSGIVVAGMVPLALEAQYATGSVLSDPLFCVLVWLTLSLAASEKPWELRRAIMIGLLCASAIAVRVAGVALVPTLLLYFLFRPARERLTNALPILLVSAGIIVLVVFARDQIPFFNRLELGQRLNLDSLRAFVSVYKDALLTQMLYPMPTNVLNDIYHVLALPPLVVGAVSVVKRQPRSVLWYFAGTYTAMLIVAPVRDGRYAWPLAPIVAWWLVAGIKTFGARLVLGSALRPTIVGALVAGLLCLGAAGSLTSAPPRASFTGDADTREVFAYVQRLHGDSAVRAMFINPRVLTLETGVPAMGIPFGTQDEVLREIGAKRLTILVLKLAGLTRASERNMIELVNARPDLFPEVLRNASYTVRRVHQPVVQAPGGAAVGP